jgi:TolB-like protein/DNA-binding winged helix-turn-helix (wHTH) protein/Tfp pilus assembly protein PilF
LNAWWVVMSSQPVGVRKSIRFGEGFQLELRPRRLRQGSRVLKLERIPLELLILFLERPAEIVTRDEIVSRIWGKDIFLDADNSIRGAIRKVRQALKDDSEHPRFIQTITGQGYRFIAPISAAQDEDHVATIPPPTGSPQEHPRLANDHAGPSQRFGRWVLLGAIGFSALLVMAVIAFWSRSRTPIAPTIRSLAVLPLKNLSGDPTQDYLADGITEELIGRLAGIRDLRVISRTSVMHFNQTKLLVPEIARQLGVDAIVEGSVIRDGNLIRIHAQLIRAATDEHIWANQYQRQYEDVLALEDDLTRNIAQQIEVNLQTQQAGSTSPHQVDPATYEDYLKGRYYFNQRTPTAVNKSIASFTQAITRDPKFALAYSGLADAYALLGYRGAYPSTEALSQAKKAAWKAIELDSNLAEPHISLAFIAETYEWDWASSEREYKRALELNPNDSRAHHFFASYLTYVGRFDEGIAEEKRARELDPLSLPVNTALAGRFLAAGRSQEALSQVRATLDLDSSFAPVHQTLGWIYLKGGKSEEAVEEFRRAVELSGANDIYLRSDLAFACAVTGKREEAKKALADFKSLHLKGLAPSGSIAIVYGALGEKDEAFAWLEQAYQERDPELTYIKVGRRFDPLRNDPRLQQLVHRMGLPD